MSKPYDTIPFTNTLGQVIQPGDQVLIVTEGYSHRIMCRTGTFLGVRNLGRHLATVVRVTYKGSGYVTKDGTKCSYSSPDKVGYGNYEYIRQQTYYSNRLFKLA
jgi:hypothetical protein